MNPEILTTQTQTPTPNLNPKSNYFTKFLNIFFVIAFLIIFGYFFLAAPDNNKDVIVHITKNQSVDSIAKDLDQRNVIRHDFVLKILLKVFNFDKGISPGDYLFAQNKSVIEVAWQIARNKHNVEPIKITIKEGMTNVEIADILGQKITLFRRDLFLSHENSKQGYLFPDTYFFFPLSTTDEIVDQLSSNFDRQLKKVENDLKSSSKTEGEIIVMASIIEREAKGGNDSAIISGILWKRISIGMPLQVDVEKSTYSVHGLPANPINNPGLSSIKAALNPESSPYLYYLHDKSGVIHLALNYDEHKINIEKYLK